MKTANLSNKWPKFKKTRSFKNCKPRQQQDCTVLETIQVESETVQDIVPQDI
jgi:hypothetical protein